MNRSYSTTGLTFLTGFLMSLLGGCEYKFARQKERAFEAIESNIRDARERFMETGSPVHELHAKQQEEGLALLYPELPAVPTPYFAFIVGGSSLPKGELIVHWIERGKDVEAIEIRTPDETHRYRVEYNKQTLGDSYDDQVFRRYDVYFADKIGSFPSLSANEVIVLPTDVCEGLLSGTMSASIRLVYVDGSASIWLDCIKPIGSERAR